MYLRVWMVVPTAVFLSACATVGPYVEVVAESQKSGDGYEEPVRITAISGGRVRSGTTTVPLRPGFHVIMARTTRKDEKRSTYDFTLPLRAQPCMRYYLVARHESLTAVDPWKTEIKRVEPISGCPETANGDQPASR